MRIRPVIVTVACLLCLGGALWLWHAHERSSGQKNFRSAAVTTVHSLSTAPTFLAKAMTSTNAVKAAAVSARTNQLAYRLSNTSKTLGQLLTDSHAILLENALIDSSQPLDLKIPKQLQSQGDPGAYIVQARGPIDAAFRAMLAQYGAQIVSYIPNNAYLVEIPAAVANAISDSGIAQSVIPYEPYYKIQPSLLSALLQNQPLPTEFNVAVYPNSVAQFEAAAPKAGWTIESQQSSPFGKVFTIQGNGNLTALAQMSQIQIIEPSYPRIHANDLSRVTLGVSTDPQVTTNYLNLDGSGVMIEVNDSGIDATHPDLTGRIFGDADELVDTNGHGTHVAGIIAGDGTESTTVTEAQGSIMPGVTGQFRGMAPKADLLSMDFEDSDFDLQQAAALTNALISNNSWNYGDADYDLAAASYDAATRDALPGVTGSQPVLFVFSAGNSGGGGDDGYGGVADTILSPATAKNVITVGALEEYRYITNIVTDLNSNQTTPWLPETDSSTEVASFSSRGNVGIGYEGTSGRYKPDVVAPGTFVISTRSSQWDEQAYYNPTNDSTTTFSDQIGPDSINFYPSIFIPSNAVQMSITVSPNENSPSPFPAPYICLWQGTDPHVDGTMTLMQTNSITIPPQGSLSPLGTDWTYGISNNVDETVSYDVTVHILTTNDLGNYLEVLSNLNNTLDGDPDSTKPPHYYRYESGTSMSAADVSGVLALMQQYFTNAFQMTPSPALMKAMLINGARSDGNYDFQVQNSINFQGWGLVNLPDTLLPGITNQFGAFCSDFFVDQSVTNALATGDSQTYTLTMNPDSYGQYYPLKITLAWSDPPGNPSAAVKLVNNLELIVTNLDDPTNPIIYYGNDIASGNTYNTPESASTNPPPFDVINNVQNVIISADTLLGTNYSITILGRAVNVNSVSAQTNTYANNGPSGTYAPNIAQDYALAISSGEGEEPDSFSVTDDGITANPTSYQNITYITATNQPLLNQFVGANSPIINAGNTISFTTNATYGGGAEDTVGTTNQWHFYVVTNNAVNSSGSSSDVTNAGFITFSPDTLSIPRMGTVADSITNATRPEADIDLYVASAPSASGLTNLDPTVISNCVNSVEIGKSVGGIFYGASLGRGGTEYVVDTNSTPGQVYYVGVKSEDQMASEYGFISIFSDIPFSSMDKNGVQTVNGQPLPINILDGSPAFSQPALAFGIALYPIQVQDVIVTNVIPHQNFGDLIGTLTHGNQTGGADTTVVLNNHDSFKNTIGSPPFVYDDATNPTPAGLLHSDGPGSLNNYVSQDGSGVWIMSESDTAPNHTGSLNSFEMRIDPHHPLDKGVTVTIQPGQWYYDYIDVPPGVTNLTIGGAITNLIDTQPVEMFVRFGAEPTLTNFDKMAVISNSVPPPPIWSNSISIGPSDVPPIQPGRYWIGLYNPSANTYAQDVYLVATLTYPGSGNDTIPFDSSGSTAILDDAVTYSTIPITNDLPVASVNVGIAVQHPRISDLVFHLISPDGTRVLLMENRGGDDPNGAGADYMATNTTWHSSFESSGGNSLPATGTYFSEGWYVDSGSVDLLTSGTFGSQAYEGNYYIDINGNNPATISTNITTVPGQTYQLSFAYSRNPDGAGNPTVQLLENGNVLLNLTVVTNNSWASLGWRTTSVVFTATAANTQIQFASETAGSYGALLDDINLTTVQTNYAYLTFTEDTNLTITPIKFAMPPFLPDTNTVILFTNSFEGLTATDYFAGQTFSNWTVVANQVSLVNDSANSYDGSNFLALANGVISNTLPTVAGKNYTLTFAYRGPGIVSMWEGESNANDSVGANNGIANNITYTNGLVGRAFVFNGSGSSIDIPASASLNVGTNNSGYTLETWVNPIHINSPSQPQPLFEWNQDVGNGLDTIGAQMYVAGHTAGDLYANIVDTGFGQNNFWSAGNIMTSNSFQHVAVTFNKVTKVGLLYRNGVIVARTNFPNSFTPLTSFDLYIGARPAGVNGPYYFQGMLDEPSIYDRVLSASEIKAISDDGNAGKYDKSAPSVAQGLAKAQISINGQPPTTISGNNTSWQIETITFTATQNGTPIQISGIEPGMLLDDFVLTQVPGNLYYLPEESLDAFDGENADGPWTLEIQDDRAGEGLTNLLASWQLQFVFDQTNAVPANLVGGSGQTNQFIPADSIAWYQINVPSTANYATNILSNASAPVNVWWSINTPPTITNSGDFDLIPNSTGNTESPAVLTTDSTPEFIVQGGTYYLGVQNTNSSTVSYDIEVDFDQGNGGESSVGPAISSVSVSGNATTLNWTASPDAEFQVQWTDDLTQPWTTDTNTITSSDGNFSFTDDGSQTAPLGSQRFYRLVQISP